MKYKRSWVAHTVYRRSLTRLICKQVRAARSRSLHACVHTYVSLSALLRSELDALEEEVQQEETEEVPDYLVSASSASKDVAKVSVHGADCVWFRWDHLIRAILTTMK